MQNKPGRGIRFNGGLCGLIVLTPITLVGCGGNPVDRSLENGATDESTTRESTPAGPPFPSEPPSALGNPKAYMVNGTRYDTLSSGAGYVARGIASWYGKEFQGKRTSNGETYDMMAMTAAHKTLPLPSYVQVTNLENGSSVVVRVNDRGPFHEGRIIDLSVAAAQQLGIYQQGTGMVEVKSLSRSVPQDAAIGADSAAARAEVYIQVGAFASEAFALQLRDRLASAHIGDIEVHSGQHNGHAIYRVRVGPLPSVDDADETAVRLSGLGIQDTRIVFD